MISALSRKVATALFSLIKEERAGDADLGFTKYVVQPHSYSFLFSLENGLSSIRALFY